MRIDSALSMNPSQNILQYFQSNFLSFTNNHQIEKIFNYLILHKQLFKRSSEESSTELKVLIISLMFGKSILQAAYAESRCVIETFETFIQQNLAITSVNKKLKKLEFSKF